MTHSFSLPKTLIGVASAALQIEGGDRNNDWYDWAGEPGRIADGSTPLRATDHWNRWRDDTSLMAELGLAVYRMSVEWARLEPREGVFDDEVMARYVEELTAVKEAGIIPLVSLHHFTNPRWFAQAGQFTNPRSVEWFTRFTRYVVSHLSGIVDEWVTINEPNVYATGAHLFAEFPPGDKSWTKLRRVIKNLAHAHCKAYEAIHELAPNAKVGFAHHMRPFVAMNASNPLHRLNARVGAYLFQEALSDAMLVGKFPAILGQPKDVSPGRYYDYLGLNYYSRTASAGFGSDGTLPNRPVNDLGWEIYPEGLVECGRWLQDRYEAPVWVSENGTCDNPSESRIEHFRSRYIYDHLKAIAQSDVDFERYYHWCFVDNWEWAEGEVPRFGLVGLDYETQERTLKPSAHFVADIIANQGVTEDAYQRWVAHETYTFNK